MTPARLRQVLCGIATSPLLLMTVIGASGLVMIGLTWRSVAGEDRVSTQVAYIVSGGLGGLGIVGFALGALSIQLRRMVEAGRRATLDHLIVVAGELLDAARAASARKQ